MMRTFSDFGPTTPPAPATAPASLAVVIPAYRRRFLAETLAGFAAQTDRRFHLYVVDDASPEDLAPVVQDFAERLPLSYHRFAENLGGSDMAQNWARAIGVSHEPWLWLFSDDDVPGPDCVAMFHRHQARSAGRLELLRFDLAMIDERGASVGVEPEFPQRLSAVEYVEYLVRRPGGWCVIQNMVFAREVFRREGGFVAAPAGFASDPATWPRFARSGGVVRLEATVYFRRHAGSLGTMIGAGGTSRAAAFAGYAMQLRAWREILPPARRGSRAWRRLERSWFGHHIRFLPRPLERAERARVRAEMARLWPEQPCRRQLLFWRNYLQLVGRELRRRVGRRRERGRALPA